MKHTMFRLVLVLAGGCDPAFEPRTENDASLQDTAVVSTAAVPQAPAPTCSGDRCNGQDPVVTGCDASAETIATKRKWVLLTGWVTVDQRYSRTCGTRWSRFTSDGATYSTAEIWVPGKGAYSWNYAGTRNWSDMYYCPRKTCRAEASAWYGSYKPNGAHITTGLVY